MEDANITVGTLDETHTDQLYSLIERSREKLLNLVWAASATEQSTREFLLAKEGSPDTVFGIYKGSALVGVVELRNFEHTFELGYWLGAGYRGQGIMLEAVRPLVASMRGRKPVTAHIRCGNHASRSVLTRSGLSEHHREIWKGEEWIHFSTVHAGDT